MSLKNKYAGERVWIVGNGPSLNKTNLDLIAGEHSIAMNRISLIFERTTWRPSMYLYCSDNVHNSEWGEGWRSSVNDAVANPTTTSLIWRRYLDVVESDGTIIPIDAMTEMELASDGTFSTNADQHISKTGTSINAAYQLAYYMGFSQIFLIGADLNWKTGGGTGADHNHFDPNYRAHIPDGERERRRMRLTHKYANAHFKEAGIQAFNATTDTLLDVFPLVDFETVARDKSWKPSGTEGHPVLNPGDEFEDGISERRHAINENWQFAREGAS